MCQSSGKHGAIPYKSFNPYPKEADCDVPHLLKTSRNCFSNSFAHSKSRTLKVRSLIIIEVPSCFNLASSSVGHQYRSCFIVHNSSTLSFSSSMLYSSYAGAMLEAIDSQTLSTDGFFVAALSMLVCTSLPFKMCELMLDSFKKLRTTISISLNRWKTCMWIQLYSSSS